MLLGAHLRLNHLAARMHGPPDRRPVPLRVSIIQGSVRNSWQERTSDVRAIARLYSRLTAKAYDESSFDLCVWPEYAIPGDPLTDQTLFQIVSQTARQHKITLVAGCAPKFSAGADRRRTDSALVFGPTGRLLGRYDSVRPMPLDTEVERRKELRLFRTPVGRFGILICFEEGSQSLASRYMRLGADFLVVMVNHSSFDETRGLGLAFNQSLACAIEHRIPIVRASNTGLSALVDARGECTFTLPVHVQCNGTGYLWY